MPHLLQKIIYDALALLHRSTQTANQRAIFSFLPVLRTEVSLNKQPASSCRLNSYERRRCFFLSDFLSREAVAWPLVRLELKVRFPLWINSMLCHDYYCLWESAAFYIFIGEKERTARRKCSCRYMISASQGQRGFLWFKYLLNHATVLKPHRTSRSSRLHINAVLNFMTTNLTLPWGGVLVGGKSSMFELINHKGCLILG